MNQCPRERKCLGRENIQILDVVFLQKIEENVKTCVLEDSFLDVFMCKICLTLQCLHQIRLV